MLRVRIKLCDFRNLMLNSIITSLLYLSYLIATDRGKGLEVKYPLGSQAKKDTKERDVQAKKSMDGCMLSNEKARLRELCLFISFKKFMPCRFFLFLTVFV